MNPLSRLFGDSDSPPAPEDASPEDVERYNMEFAKAHGITPTFNDRSGDDAAITSKAGPSADESLGRNVKHKAEFPWLYDPQRGVRWDFDPIALRNLAQTNTWVGMLVQSITKEVAETPWTIVEADGRVETQKRLSTHPEERSPVEKAESELPDATAERIHDLLMRPNPDDTWNDLVEMWLGDLLEVGSMTAVKAFNRRAYDGDEFTADLSVVEPRALQPSAPEVWTKDYHDKTDVLDGYWQFDDHRSPGSGDPDGATVGHRGTGAATFFDTTEMVWSDMTPRTNRRYGIPPTLLVDDFLKSMDLAVSQEQQYLSRGSLPSGAAVFEEWDREELKEWKEENEENIKGKPWKWLTIAGKGGDFKFEPFTYNFQEMQFEERMKWYARVVSSAFQVPTAVVGIEPEQINYSTFQGERENFEANTLGPYLQKLERVINMDIIRPHWGSGYRFEFMPGMSESTRAMISERVTREFKAGLRRRNEARREVGLTDVEEEFNGFQDEVVEDTSPEDALDGIMASTDGAVEKGDPTAANHQVDPGEGVGVCENTGEEFECETMGDLAGDCPHCGDPISHIDPEDVEKATGAAVAFPNAGGPAFESRTTLFDFCDELAEVCDGEVFVGDNQYPDEMGGELDGQPVRAVGIGERKAYAVWSRYRDEAVALSDPHAIDSVSEVVEQEAEEGNGSLRKDEPLRETDDWYQFDVQPHMVEDLTEEIADDVRELFDEVLSDDDIQRVIDRLATDDDEAVEKSLSAISRRLREIFDESDVVARIQRALRDETAAAARETVESALGDAAEAGVETDVDVQAIEAQLADREVEFADAFVDEIQDDILETVGDGWAEGKATQDIADEIAEQADINSGWHGAERIARQELHMATGEARSEVAGDLGKIEVWQTSGDGRVRPAHDAMQGEWKRPGDDWVVDYSEEARGVQKESVPGDSEPGIGCRCTTLLRDRETVDQSEYGGDGALN